MPKFPTYPTLYDEVLQINISKLKEWNYLNPEQLKSGTLTWSSNGEKTASISITVNTNDRPYIELDYKSNDEPRKYKVSLVSIPSNLGKGKIWYFLCPQTLKRCRKLYSISGYFLHLVVTSYIVMPLMVVCMNAKPEAKDVGLWIRFTVVILNLIGWRSYTQSTLKLIIMVSLRGVIYA